MVKGELSALADRYTIERELGRGGMATVYLAQDVRHDVRSRSRSGKGGVPWRCCRSAGTPTSAPTSSSSSFASTSWSASRTRVSISSSRCSESPFYLSPGWLRLDPAFDALRNNPRFRKLVEGTA